MTVKGRFANRPYKGASPGVVRHAHHERGWGLTTNGVVWAGVVSL